VVVHCRPKLPAAEIDRLDGVVRRDAAAALLLENQTGMRHRVAASAYLTLMTCPRVDARTLVALRASGPGAATSGRASRLGPSASRPPHWARASSP
jgi:hypothetical protein